MCLVAMPGVGVGEIEEPCGKGTCFVHAADEQTRLAQLGEHQRIAEHAPASGQVLQHLVQERQGLRRTQEGGRQGELQRYVSVLGERQAPFQQGDGLLEHPLAAVEQTHTTQHDDHTVGLRHRLRQSDGFFAYTRPLGEVPQFGQTPGRIATGEYAREDGEAEALPREHCEHPLRDVQRLLSVPS